MTVLVYVVLMAVVAWDLYFFIPYILALTGTEMKREWEPEVSVIIPAHNEEANIGQAIRSVLESGYKKMEVLIVDDGSEDGTYSEALKLSRDGRVKVIRVEHRGKAGALNEGLKVAKGEIIVTMDADCVMEKAAINRLVERFYNDRVVAVGGQVRVVVESFLSLMQDVEHLRIAMFRRARELENLSIAPGPVSAFRAETLRSAGGFSEDLVEDYATTAKLKKKGRVVYAPGAVVRTRMPSSLRNLWRQRVRWVTGDLGNLRTENLRKKVSIAIGDVVAILDVVLPFILIGSPTLLIAWIAFEIGTILPPAIKEGTPEKWGWVEVVAFPLILWLWALFYSSLHIYCYFNFYVLGRKTAKWE